MIEVSNYSTQIIELFNSYRTKAVRKGHENIREDYETLIQFLLIGEHFILPKNSVFDTMPTIPEGQELELNMPFPITTFEVRMEYANTNVALIVLDGGHPTFTKYNDSEDKWDEDTIQIHTILKKDGETWGTNGVLFSLPKKIITHAEYLDIDTYVWSKYTFDLVHELPNNKKYSTDQLLRKIAGFHSLVFKGLISFCLLSSCDNIIPTKLNTVHERTNNKRLKKNKPPLFEYHTLTIDLSKGVPKHTPTKSEARSHQSPRTHYRRGHIRRLPDKKVWVHSCMVNPDANGVIEKQYVLQ